jgi:hypothetical protein
MSSRASFSVMASTIHWLVETFPGRLEQALWMASMVWLSTRILECFLALMTQSLIEV